MRRAIILAGSLVLLGASPALADQFIGVEGGDAGAEAGPSPTVTKRSPKHVETSEASDSSSDGRGSISDDFAFYAALAAGTGYFSGQATLGYSLVKYASIDTTYSYIRYDSGTTTGEQYGPEIDLVLRLPNKTIVTPFLGAGPGYTKWLREYDQVAFSEGSSVTGNVFGGLGIRLTRHFGIQVERRQVTYYNKLPKRFDDREKDEPQATVATNIGFHVVF